MMFTKKAHYGYYGLPIIGIIVLILFIAGFILLYFVSEYVGWIIIGFSVYLIISYGIAIISFSTKTEKDIPDNLIIRGNEQVLDVGCGLGRLSIAVAKRLKDGKVIGIDIWDKKELWNNSPEVAYKNAEIEGVKDKVDFKYGDVLKIPFSDNIFDLVTCGSVLNNLRGEKERLKALSEIYRVLKPRGKLLLIEPLKNLRMFFLFTPFGFWQLSNRNEWEKLINMAGFKNTRYFSNRGLGYFLTEKVV